METAEIQRKRLFVNGFRHALKCGTYAETCGISTARLFWGKPSEKLRAKHSAPKAFWCVFGVVLAQGKSPCSEATTDEAVFCFNSTSDGRSPKSPPPFREWAVIVLQGTLKALCLALGTNSSTPLARAGKGLLRAFLS